MRIFIGSCIALALFALPAISIAEVTAMKTAARPELDQEVTAAIASFKNEIKGGDEILAAAKGYLIFPKVTKAGIGIGGEYGKGALVVDGKILEYYSTKAASIGAQLGVQTKSIVVTFTTDQSLQSFRDSNGWEVGVDGSVALAEMGAEGSVNTTTMGNKPIVAYVYGQSGLMADVSISGSKFSKLEG